MRIIFEEEAEIQLYNLGQIVDDLNISGAGARWINKFLDYIVDYAKPNVSMRCANIPNWHIKDIAVSPITRNGL